MILSIPLLAVVFLSLVRFASCQTSASDKTFMQALADIPECRKYYEFLQQHPDAQSPPSDQDYLVFCPTNDAVERKLAAPPGSNIKRDDNGAKKAAALLTAQGPKVTKRALRRAVPIPSANPTSTPRAPPKRQVPSLTTSLVTEVHSSSTTIGATSSTASTTSSTAGAASATASSASGGSLATSTASATSFGTSGSDPIALDPSQLTLITTLNDPAFVNLGPGEAARMVFFGSPLNLKLICGLGNVVNVIRGNIPFKGGMISVVDKYVSQHSLPCTND